MHSLESIYNVSIICVALHHSAGLLTRTTRTCSARAAAVSISVTSNELLCLSNALTPPKQCI